MLEKDEQIDYAMSGKNAAQIELWSKIYAGKAPWLNKNIAKCGGFRYSGRRDCKARNFGVEKRG